MNKIIALHGFLGETQDFLPLELDIYAPRLNRWPIESLDDWADKFNDEVNGEVLLGYSLGGRLALHSLIKDQNFKAAIIISAHPGLKSDQERFSRIENDKRWANRFLNESWENILVSWNEQNIFNGSRPIAKIESSFSRKDLFSYLDKFSLGRQKDLRHDINNLSLPILWLMPKSEKEKIDGLKLLHPSSKIELVDGGHRFIFDHPNIAAGLIKNFLQQINI